MSYIYDKFGRPIKIETIQAINRLETLKKKHGGDPWPVIEECFKIWIKSHPKHWNSYLYNLGNIKATRKDKKFASSYDRKTGGTLRYTLDIPQPVFYMISALYEPGELQMNRDFFIEFGKRFPQFKVAEKI